MGLFNGVNNVGSLVQFGNRGDVCVLTARELAVQEKIDIGQARMKLRGHLEGKRIVKIRQSGADIVISLDAIHKIAEEFPRVTEETPTVEEEIKIDDEAKDPS
ncbi:hypothetical protein [Bacillus atrophaeus]|uniref:hypothetical protein n=1 Tax=Bacillus atrophaeus TaxID=1452 RepID=UPI002E247790|nr:hypothetical protein [Bacillus atrophaeus]